MEDLLELLVWALIVGLGWLWSRARTPDRASTRRTAGIAAPVPGRPAPQGVRSSPPPAAVPGRAGGARPPGEGLSVEEASEPQEGAAERGLGVVRPATPGAVAAALGPAVRGVRVAPARADELLRALVMAEVLGPPRALRPYRTPVAARRLGR